MNKAEKVTRSKMIETGFEDQSVLIIDKVLQAKTVKCVVPVSSHLKTASKLTKTQTAVRQF